MKIIAHRGASSHFHENTIQAFHFAADQGADLIEMDLRLTADGVFVVVHDPTLERVDASKDAVDQLTVSQLQARFCQAGWPEPLRLDQLDRLYARPVPLLFHIKTHVADAALVADLKRLSLPFVCGIEGLGSVGSFLEAFGRDRLLAFMPQVTVAGSFMDAGVGIIRLWQDWFDPAIVQGCHDRSVAVWVMTGREQDVGQTNPDVLDRLEAGGADGVLLNDICLARHWRKSRSGHTP